MIKLESFEKPFLIDLMKVTSDSKNQYDLPFYFMGQAIKMNFKYETPSSLSPLGDDNGYQHLYLEGKGKPTSDTTQFSWLGEGKYYTLTTATDADDEILLTRIGANDPDFNLRRDAAVMLRRKDSKNTTFASIIEPHGAYSPVSELSENSNSNISELKIIYDDANYTAVSIKDLKGNMSVFILANKEASMSKSHKLKVDGKLYRWTGAYHFKGS